MIGGVFHIFGCYLIEKVVTASFSIDSFSKEVEWFIYGKLITQIDWVTQLSENI